MAKHPLTIWRFAADMTLKQVAEKINVSEGYLSFVENGKRNPSPKVVGAIYSLTKGAVGPDAFPKKENIPE